ncbi:Plasmid-partitioning protein ParA [Vibrio coralliirubri]|uniref:Plasmid-partitioning protein ParA n=1 Tax=Vibrio coralliirubri TaxID=1516159 RepID=A0AA86XTM9_9VIBR|nr:ParA family protein [Vibrio coralliirubri]CDT14105.1 Plasmid-partitioning protein ParA [Vibrio coralliirubri]CDT14396.1 Plasmid-partitioning protein ParA [Vibrio coralliirubri]CDT52442.1 Plasmid-partitioning protein ParA [Vibrio coralliirubri]CDT74297.1 Plasmid-partitioning protein ParA [Vibrio coralliirubri]CDT75710.1 Plasmid-partitioning protein ParA [Vibrio coralliirubri]
MKREQTIDKLYQLAEQTQQVQADRIEIILEERSDEHFPPMSKAMMETRSGLTRRKLDEAITKLEADGHQFTKNNANHYSISLTEAHMLMDAAEVPKFHERKQHADNKPWIINVQNQKGGTGKSMTAVHLAACLSLNLDKRYRICLIDLDPQGSLRLFLNPQISGAEHDSIYSAVDIMLDNVPEGQEVDLEFLRKNVLLPTQYPNLKTISAFPEDAMFNAEAWQSLSQDQSLDIVRLLKEKLIDKIADDFDVIMIDTGPHVDPLVWNAMYASNALLIPCAAKRLDWASTVNFFQHLPTVYEMFPDDWKGLEFVRLMPTMFEDDNKKQVSVLTEMNYLLNDQVMMATIPRSRAFETCADTYSTVFDLTVSDFEGGKKTLAVAQDAVQKSALELERVLHSNWPSLNQG